MHSLHTVDNAGDECVLAGILKFHEYYLGDSMAENAGDIHEASSVGFQTVTNSALELHISSVREALGVDSYYTR